MRLGWGVENFVARWLINKLISKASKCLGWAVENVVASWLINKLI